MSGSWTCRDGEIGRRSGLKIRRGQKPCGGSIPPPGTSFKTLRPERGLLHLISGHRSRSQIAGTPSGHRFRAQRPRAPPLPVPWPRPPVAGSDFAAMQIELWLRPSRSIHVSGVAEKGKGGSVLGLRCHPCGEGTFAERVRRPRQRPSPGLPGAKPQREDSRPSHRSMFDKSGEWHT